MTSEITFTVYGEPASKANSRRLVRFGSRVASIKSAKALGYVDAFQLQCPRLKTVITTPVAVFIEIFYSSRRPDLDDSLILDAMQGRVIKNDRQIQERHILWNLDRANPRAVIRVVPIPDRGGAAEADGNRPRRQRPKAPGAGRRVA